MREKQNGLSLNTQINRALKKQFQQALSDCASGEYIPYPKSLEKFRKLSLQSVKESREQNLLVRNELDRRTTLLLQLPLNLTKIVAMDMAARSMLVQYQLVETGAIYGDESYNFCLYPLPFSKETVRQIETTALTAFNTIVKSTASLPSVSLNSSETFLDQLNLAPNGARIDILLGDRGPRVIEANMSWVDGIQALESLLLTFRGPSIKAPTELLASVFRGRKKLAIIYLPNASGSRSQGEINSLRLLKENLESQTSFQKVEIIDPNIYQTIYLNTFDCFYIDGDPRMLNRNQPPEWLINIYNRLKSKSVSVFPIWNPRKDKKAMLVGAYANNPDIFAPTYPFSTGLLSDDIFIKGDSYSSLQVADSTYEIYANLVQEASSCPSDFVLQKKNHITLYQTHHCL